VVDVEAGLTGKGGGGRPAVPGHPNHPTRHRCGVFLCLAHWSLGVRNAALLPQASFYVCDTKYPCQQLNSHWRPARLASRLRPSSDDHAEARFLGSGPRASELKREHADDTAAGTCSAMLLRPTRTAAHLLARRPANSAPPADSPVAGRGRFTSDWPGRRQPPPHPIRHRDEVVVLSVVVAVRLSRCNEG
jgi:hypothetical protein